MAEESRTTQILFGSRGMTVMVAIFVTSYVVLAGTVSFLMYERVGITTGDIHYKIILLYIL